MKRRTLTLLLLWSCLFGCFAAEENDSLNSIVDEVIWVVGDEPILKSDVEQMRLQASMEGVRFKGNPDCSIPEQIAVQKLFLHQAAILR